MGISLAALHHIWLAFTWRGCSALPLSNTDTSSVLWTLFPPPSWDYTIEGLSFSLFWSSIFISYLSHGLSSLALSHQRLNSQMSQILKSKWIKMSLNTQYLPGIAISLLLSMEIIAYTFHLHFSAIHHPLRHLQAGLGTRHSTGTILAKVTSKILDSEFNVHLSVFILLGL